MVGVEHEIGSAATAVAFDNPEAYIPGDRRLALADRRGRCPIASTERRSSPTSPASPR